MDATLALLDDLESLGAPLGSEKTKVSGKGHISEKQDRSICRIKVASIFGTLPSILSSLRLPAGNEARRIRCVRPLDLRHHRLLHMAKHYAACKRIYTFLLSRINLEHHPETILHDDRVPCLHTHFHSLYLSQRPWEFGRLPFCSSYLCCHHLVWHLHRLHLLLYDKADSDERSISRIRNKNDCRENTSSNFQEMNESSN